MEIQTFIREKIREDVLRVLEIGSGSGYFLRELSEEFPLVSFFGVDPFITGVKKENLHLLPLKAEDIPGIEGWFDIIFSIHSFHHLHNPEVFIKNAFEKLSGGGRLIIWDWNRGADTGVPEYYYSINEVRKMVKETDLVEEGIENFGDENMFVFRKHRFNVAVATDDGKTIFKGMFGRAGYFYIYQFNKNTYKLKEKRKNPYRDTFQHLKTYDVYSVVSDCSHILTGNIGKKGENRLKELGVHILKEKSPIEEGLRRILDIFKY